MDSQNDFIVLKTKYEEKQEIRRFQVRIKDFTFNALDEMITKKYNQSNWAKHFTIKYQNEYDLFPISNEADLQSVLAENILLNSTSKDKTRVIPLNLVITEKKPNEEEPANQFLVGIANFFMLFSKLSINDGKEEEKKAMVVESKNDDMADLENMMSKITLETFELLTGSEWRGVLVYADTKEEFPMVLTVIKQNKKSIEGIIDWTSLGSTTKWLGKVKKQSFVFSEYEAIFGEDNVELPTNYKCIISGNSIDGYVYDKTKADQKDQPKFSLKFNGLNSKNEGFIELESGSKNPKAKVYNLASNNSVNGPTAEDRTNAFKKLTAGSDTWYKASEGLFQGSKKREEKDNQFSHSCKVCGQPMFEQSDINGNRVMACEKFPNCIPEYDDGYEYHHYWFIRY